MTVFLDMDGVIADFFGGVAQQFNVDHWKSIQDKEIAFASLANTDFFYNLPCFRGEDIPNDSQKIVHTVAEMTGGDWGICSSPMRGDTNNSAYWKRRWLEKWNFVPPLIENMIFTSNKHKYAMNELTRRPNILIDDKPDNIKRFRDAGGIAIRFQCNEDDIEEYLFVELEKALEDVRHF